MWVKSQVLKKIFSKIARGHRILKISHFFFSTKNGNFVSFFVFFSIFENEIITSTDGDTKGDNFSFQPLKISNFDQKKSENAISTFLNRFFSYLPHFFGKIANFPNFSKNCHFCHWKALLQPLYWNACHLKNLKIDQSAKID